MQYRLFPSCGGIISCSVILGCASTTPSSILPLALRHGKICDVTVQHPYVGGREITAALGQALKSNIRPHCCITARVVDPAGGVLAIANICGAPTEGIPDWQLADVCGLFLSVLAAIENRDSPFIEVTADADGTIVLASAAFSLPANFPPTQYTLIRPLRIFGEQHPVYLKIVAEGVHRTERLLEKGVMRYYNAQRQTANGSP